VVVNAIPTERTRWKRVRQRGARQSAVRAFRRTFRIPLTLLAQRALKKRTLDVSSVDDTLDLAYEFSYGGIVFAPWQERSEIRGLLERVKTLAPKTVLEVGTSNGGTLFCFTRVAADDALVVSVDLPHGEFGGGYASWRAPLYRSFAKGSQRVSLLRADSHDPRTLDAVRHVFEGREVDVLFIDGDHTYDGVKQDFEMYSTLVRDGGIVAFHDIVPTQESGPRPRNDYDLQGGEVPQFWAELKQSYEFVEFVEDWASGRFGIGAITMSR
jgi:cephalosporin hydroxylase